MATIQDLPLELIQLILVNFRRKRDYTLRACSLLSKSWRAATLPRLFATLRPTRKCGESSPAHIATFLDSHLDISACVKHLWLRDWYRVDADILRSLLSRLPAVERLSLELTIFGPPLPGHRPPADGHLAPPYRLRVMIVNFSELHGDASHLIDILALCEVETFKVMFLRDAMDNPRFLAKLASSPLCVRIQDLILGAQKRVAERCPTGLLRLLRASMVLGYLRSMEFTCDSWDTLSPAGALLRDVGQNITTFKLKLLGRAMFEKMLRPTAGVPSSCQHAPDSRCSSSMRHTGTCSLRCTISPSSPHTPTSCSASLPLSALSGCGSPGTSSQLYRMRRAPQTSRRSNAQFQKTRGAASRSSRPSCWNSTWYTQPSALLLRRGLCRVYTIWDYFALFLRCHEQLCGRSMSI
ncbi:hypothetical protein OH76DRAFT_267178 [Lentinus brumalis]|uniref:F-box domain-containing protein n=1 Tax=Lentinus brumalis TaxID=2498619 RepID=A0A371DGR6_9APHY|nr:hypothetical protein OH76DRAFT_267178 [Polyporus brumalis]